MVQKTKDTVDAEGALALLEGLTDLYVAKGKKTVHFDLAKARPPDDEILRSHSGAFRYTQSTRYPKGIRSGGWIQPRHPRGNSALIEGFRHRLPPGL